MIDETAARVLQERYLRGERGALGGLYAELRALGEIACRKRGMRSEEVPDITHLAAARIIERYLKGPYYVMRFYELVRRETAHALTEGQGEDRRTIELVGTEGVLVCDPPEERAFFIAEIIASSHYGIRAIIDLFFSRSWRGVLRTLATYATEQWIVNNLPRLRYIYGMTHVEKGRARVDGRRGLGGNKTAMRTLRPQVLLCGQRDAQDLVPREG